MAEAPFQKWLFRECCNTVVEVNKKYKDLEQFACKCGKKVLGENLKRLLTPILTAKGIKP